MKKQTAIILLVAIALSVSGCSALRKFTKKNDNSVLPGQREDILSPEQYKVEDATVGGGAEKAEKNVEAAVPCNPDVDLDCAATVDQEGG